MSDELEEKEEKIEIKKGDSKEFLSSLEDVKKTMIKREEYDKIIKENNELKKALLNGFTIKDEPQKTASELKKEYQEKVRNLTNLEGMKLGLQLRDAVIREGGKDPFLAPDQTDSSKAEFIAETLKQIIEDSDGDPGVFQALFNKSIS